MVPDACNLLYHTLDQEGAKISADKSPYYSKVSIIRPGRSRLLEFERKDSTCSLIEAFSKNPDQDVY